MVKILAREYVKFMGNVITAEIRYHKIRSWCYIIAHTKENDRNIPSFFSDNINLIQNSV